MADTQIRGLGTGSAPLSYTVPGSQEIILKSLFASFDGSAAAAAFLPCVRIVAPGGGVVGEYITDSSVAAGSSAEVSFAPFLRNAATGAGGALGIEHNGALIGSEANLDFEDGGVTWTVTDNPGSSRVEVTGTGGAGGTGLPWCFMQRTSVSIPNYAGVTTGVDFDLTNGHVSGFSSDAAIFTAGAPVGGGLHGIEILAEGQYLWAASAVFNSAAPAAGATAAVRTSWDNGDTWVAGYVDTFKTGPGAGTTQAQPSLVEQFNLKAGGTAPPQDSTVFLSQNSGAAITVGQVTLAVYQFSPTGTLQFT